MTEEIFQKLYAGLNNKQKEAVDAIEGPVMVIAGPGTGKTSILTLRIANILRKTDTPPESILALTFTESGAYSMRKKLVEIIGSAGYKVVIHTFHGFCNEVIKNYPESFPRILRSTNSTDIDQIRILEEIIEKTKLSTLKPYGDSFYYLRPALSSIKSLKREDVSVTDFEKAVKTEEKEFKKIPDLYYESGRYAGEMKGKYKDREKSIKKNKELVILYQKYQEALDKKKLYDYEDMILEVLKALRKDKDLLLRLQEKYFYILADEHQDVNNAQNHLLEILASFHENPNLFIVGDEKQAIFRFQGASLENFLYFEKLYPSVRLVRLEENYRSTQTILDASHSLIQKSEGDQKLRVRLLSKKGHEEKPILLHELPNPEAEYLFIVSDIEEKIKGGVDPRGIAILYRDNKDAFRIAKYLEKTKIPFTIESDQDILSDDEMAKFVLLLRAINIIGNDEEMSRAFFIDFLKVDHVDLYRILSFASKKKVHFTDVIRSVEFLKQAGVKKPEHIASVTEKFGKWSSKAKNINLLDFLEFIIRESAFLGHILSLPNSLEVWNKLGNFFGEARRLVESHKDYKLAELMRYLDTLKDQHIYIKAKVKSAYSQGVRLMTAHKSKGLEFDFVYIVQAVDGHWGNKRTATYFHLPVTGLSSIKEKSLDDERRLFYVALTRARKQAIITYARESEDGENRLPSQFIEEIDKKHISKSKGAEEDAHMKLSGDLKLRFAPRLHTGIDLKDKEYLTALFLDQGLSVTALNNYLKCPWNFFFINLIHIPRTQTKHQLYGTAIHETLKTFFDKWREGEDLNAGKLQTLFESNLKKKPLSESEFEETLEKGTVALASYYKCHAGSWPRTLITEFNIAGVHIETDKNEKEKALIHVRGILDKIEILPDGKVNVVDYKTAKPKSRNDLIGKTKNATGDYYRQLVFYKLLLDRYDEGKYNMVSGAIDFVEPDGKGQCRKEVFEISKAEVLELEELIKKIGKEILTFSFWDKKCKDALCEYCYLRSVIETGSANE